MLEMADDCCCQQDGDEPDDDNDEPWITQQLARSMGQAALCKHASKGLRASSKPAKARVSRQP